MDSQTTETKTPLPSRSKVSEICKSFENLNPNLSSPTPSPGLKKIANSQGEMEPSGPLSGSGRVAHLVEAFERLLKDEYGSNNNQSYVKNQDFGGRAAENQVSSSCDNSLPACFWVKSDISTHVARFLIENGAESLLGTIKIAVLPIAKVFTMCFLGFLMASKYVNILPASGRKLLNALVFSLLLPCLIFSQLGQAVTLQKMIEWWFIPFNVICATISGSLIGLVVATIVRPPYPFFKFTVIHVGIGNIGNVPLVLLAALCRDQSNPFGDTDTCTKQGTAYISFGQWVGAIVLYTYVFQMLAPPPEGTFDVDEHLPIKGGPKDGFLEQVPLLTHESLSSELNTPKQGKIRDFFVYMYDKLKIQQILQPPIIASILAMSIGAVPFLKKLIFTPNAPLFFFTDSLIILGEAMIPCILLALGGNLVDGNIGNVPLVLLAALCRDQSNPFGDTDTCTKQGTAYISFGQWVGAIVLYTYVFQMLAPPPEGTFDVDEHLPIKGGPKDGFPEQVPLLTHESLSSELNTPKQGKIRDFFVYMYDKLKIQQILQPPIIASLVFSLLLPCLIFSQLGQAVTLQKMIEWWFIPFNVICATISGSLIGLVVATIVRPPYPFFKFTVIHVGIGNIGNVPLVLLAALCRDQSNPFGDTDTCTKQGTAYISFGQWVGAIVLYTYVFQMLAPPPEGTFDVDEHLPIKGGPKDSFPEQVPLLTHESLK